MRRSFVICALIFCAALISARIAAQDSADRSINTSPTPGRIPYITGVDYQEAPSGAVVQLTIMGDAVPGMNQQFNLTFEGKSTDYVVVDRSTVAAVVPELDGQQRGKPLPCNIIFFREGEGGDVYSGFRVLPPTDLKGKEVEIVGVRRQTNDSSFFDVRFDDDIPLELWGQVRIFFDDKPVERNGIIKMAPRMFTVKLPPGLPSAASYDVYATVGVNKTSSYKFVPLVPVLDSASESFRFGWWWFFAALSAISALGGLSFLSYYFYRESKRTERLINSRKQDQKSIEIEYLPDQLPSDLVDACVAGECVLYAGAGLSAQSGLPIWEDFIRSLLNWSLDHKYISETEEASFHAGVDAAQSDPVADSIVSKLKTKEDQALLNDYLRKVFLRSSSPSECHFLLKRSKFSAVLTTNFDNLLERVYEVRPGQVYTPKETESLLTALTKRDFFILKLYGTLDSPDTVMVAPAQYEDAITGNRNFSQFMQTLFFSRTLLFVGASLEGIDTYLRGISLPKDIVRKHYALVAVSDNAWRAKADLLERRYGIKVLPYTPGEKYVEIGVFLKKLAEEVDAHPDSAESKKVTSRLKRLSLRNIGTFDELDLEFDSKWQIFLGDNGVGKSTILKAIALALCGDKAEPYALLA